MKTETLITGGLIIVGGIAAFVVAKKIIGLIPTTEKEGKAAGAAAAGVITGAVEGSVKKIAESVGIPDTNLDQCKRDLSAGNYWDASFSCPLPVYARYAAERVMEKVNGIDTTGGTSNLNKQAKEFIPDENQSAAEVARLKRQAANSSYVNPFKPEGSW